MTDTPHFAFPLRVNPTSSRLVYTEQDSDAEIMDCIEVLLLTPAGSREELPEYGIHELAFRENGPDLESIRRVIERWEPRSTIEVVRLRELLSEVDMIRINVGGND